MSTQTPLHLPVVIGTGRQGRKTEQVARYVYSLAMERATLDATLVDVRDYQTLDTMTDTTAASEKAWDELAGWANAFLFVLPEYNHSIPGEFKILIDKAFKEYDHKVAAIVTVSDGGIGGARAREHLIQICSALGMTVVNVPIYFSLVDTLFMEDGTITPEAAATFEPRLEKMFTDLEWHGHILRDGRKTK